MDYIQVILTTIGLLLIICAIDADNRGVYPKIFLTTVIIVIVVALVIILNLFARDFNF